MKNCAYYFFDDTINMKMNSVNLLCHIVLKSNEIKLEQKLITQMIMMKNI